MLRTAVVGGFKGDAIVNDGAEDQARDQDLQDPVNAIFHGVVWDVGWPDRSGWVNGSDYLGGVNPEKWVVVIRDLDPLPTVSVIPLPYQWTSKHGIGCWLNQSQPTPFKLKKRPDA